MTLRNLFTRKPDPSAAARELGAIAHENARRRIADKTAQLQREINLGIRRPLGPHWSHKGKAA